VSNLQLTAASSLGTLASPRMLGRDGPAGVTLAQQTHVSICQVLARKGAEHELAERVAQAFDVELPRTARYVDSGPVAFVWAGRSQWLALQNTGDARAFEWHLNSSLSGAASVVDQSDGRTIVRVSGPRARAALAKGVLIDLHPSAFHAGDTAITTVAHVGVHFWQVDAAPTYEFAVFRSFATAFWAWLTDAAAEFGVAVE
jgi:methylglutamate dehydrogenase subunit D